MRFLDPGFLLLILLAPAIWFFPVRARDVVHASLRTAVLILLAIALARPVAFVANEDPHHVFVLDRTGSIAAADAERGLEAIGGMARNVAGDGTTTLVLVGGDDAPNVDHVDRTVVVAGEGSPIGRALALAADAVPDGAPGSVTLISDGLATDPGWGDAVVALQARGVPVHTVSLPRATGLRVVGLRAEGALRVGHTARIVVDVVGASPSVGVRLTSGGRILAEHSDVRVDARSAVRLEIEPEAAGFLQLTAELVPHAGRVGSMARTFAVQDPIRVAYLGERVIGAEGKLQEMVGRGFEITPPDLAASPAEIFAQTDVVVLDDRPAATVPRELQDALVQAVIEDGKGLLVSGGRAAFGAGGWHESPLAAVLPVEFVHREEKRDPSTTLVVIIDTSGSMGGGRVQLAKEVARLAIRRLLPHDKVGIVEFYGAKRWAAPIQPASNSIEIERALNRLNAGGGTIILPAIEEAFYGMQNVRTRYKHVLVLTDGGVEAGAFEPLLRRMADKGMNVSTVLVGAQLHSEFLVDIANWGKGRFYSVPNRFSLPEVILKQPASARLPAYRPGTHPVTPQGGVRWWGGAPPTDVPPLAGYVETRAKPGAQTLMTLREADQPILSTWRYGLGRVTALMTEPTGPGTAPWRAWEGFGRLLARVITRTASDDPGPFRFTLRRRGHELILTAARTVRTDVRPVARVRFLGDATGTFDPVVFRERADGLFTATFAADPMEEVRVIAGAHGGAAAMARRLVSSSADGLAPEAQVDPAHALDLDALAATTGGVTLTPADAAASTPTAADGQRPLGLFRIWPIVALLALVIYLLDIYWRRRDRRGESA